MFVQFVGLFCATSESESAVFFRILIPEGRRGGRTCLAFQGARARSASHLARSEGNAMISPSRVSIFTAGLFRALELREGCEEIAVSPHINFLVLFTRSSFLHSPLLGPKLLLVTGSVKLGN